MYLENINSPRDLKKVSTDNLQVVAQEIREVLIDKTSKFGGHLASNLGVVEITIALHYVFDSPIDKIVFDVSHQSYVHKILTGRLKNFTDAKLIHDITGYTNPLESVHDVFNVGHTSTSISLACGLAKARDLKKNKENVIAVIGDASLDGGEAFEALNYAAELGTNLIIVVNDNNMSIPENHGSLSKKLTQLRDNDGISGNNFFESLGLEYIFVKDGHNVGNLVNTFKRAKDIDHPVVIHCCTVKGKGYSFAENNPEKWHWCHPYDIETGEFIKATDVPKENYGSIVGEYLIEKIQEDETVVAMTASVPAYIGFNAERRKIAGKQYVDVGIAEQNAVTMAAAIAKNGAKPVLVTGSSFYQRAYDQVEQEMCINKCPATLLVAFSGIHGHDSNAHAGLFDIALLGNIPGLVYLAPTNKQEYLAMLDWSIKQTETPVAIRIPWNGVHSTDQPVPKEYSKTKYEIMQRGRKVVIMGLGSFYQLGEEVAKLYEKQTGIKPTIINPRFITGIDGGLLDKLKADHELVVTLEDGIVSGGFGAKIAQYYGVSSMKTLCCGFSMDIPTHFAVDEMLQKNGLTPEQLVNSIEKITN